MYRSYDQLTLETTKKEMINVIKPWPLAGKDISTNSTAQRMAQFTKQKGSTESHTVPLQFRTLAKIFCKLDYRERNRSVRNLS